MAKTPHLFCRNGVWYHRRRVPEHLIPVIGKRMVQRSLGTTDKKEAKKLARLADVEWDARFDEAEVTLSSKPKSAPVLPLSSPRAEELVRGYVERIERRFHERLGQNPPANRAELQDMQIDAEVQLGMLRNPEDPRGDELIDSAAQALLKKAGPSPGEGQGLQYGEIVRRGLIELCRRKVATYEDDFQRPHFDHLFDVARPAQVTFGELADQYVAQELEDAALNDLPRKWTDKVHANVALIREIIGNATSVAEIDYDACRRAASILGQLPTNRNKLYPKLSLEKSIKRAQADGKPILSVTTQGLYLGTLKSILELATLKGLIPHNPAQSLRPLKRDRISESDRRLSFTLDQIGKFFTSDFYRSCAPGAEKPYSKPDRHWRFWLPLICLFMGMRPNEVCQLRASDLRRTSNGTWYIDVASTPDDDSEAAGTAPKKTIKTATSRRRVPVHPELIAIGLLEFADQRQNADGSEARLLPDLKPDQHGNLATYALKRFRDTFFSAVIKVDKRQSFYSFRHSFRDALRRCDAPPAALQALGGWSQGTLTSDAYGDKFDPDHQHQWMEKVRYPGLDLTFLHLQQQVADKVEDQAG